MKSTVTEDGRKEPPNTILWKSRTSGNIYMKSRGKIEYVRIYAPDYITYPLGGVTSSHADLEPFYGIIVLNSQV